MLISNTKARSRTVLRDYAYFVYTAKFRSVHHKYAFLVYKSKVKISTARICVFHTRSKIHIMLISDTQQGSGLSCISKLFHLHSKVQISPAWIYFIRIHNKYRSEYFRYTARYRSVMHLFIYEGKTHLAYQLFYHVVLHKRHEIYTYIQSIKLKEM